MTIVRSILLLVLQCSAFVTLAQSADGDSTGVVVHTDPRLAIVTAAMRPKMSGGYSTSGRSGVIRSGRGYRVQIYNGNDRNKATARKVDFMRRFPSIPTYMTYIQPQFRVKVGNFRSRGEAQKFVEQVHELYSPVMVVPDIIVINTFKDDQ
jgi:hypothetical protein